MELDGFSLAVGDTLSWGVGGGELLEEDGKESVAMMNCDEKMVEKNTIRVADGLTQLRHSLEKGDLDLKPMES